MITTTTARAVKAMQSLDEIRGQRVSKQTAKNLFHLRKKLSETVEFYLEQIGEVCDRLGLEMSPEGVVHFGDESEKREQFVKEIAELEQTETTIDCEPVDLSEEDFNISEQFVDQTSEFIKL